MTPSVPAHLAMNAPLSEREPGMADNHTPLPWCIPAGAGNGCVICQGDDPEKPGEILMVLRPPMGRSRVAVDGDIEANAALIVRAVNSIDAVEAERDQLREAMKGATVIANQSGTLLRERDAKIEALVKALETTRQMIRGQIIENAVVDVTSMKSLGNVIDQALTAAKGPAS